MDKRQFLINLISNGLNAMSGIAISFFLTPYIVETLGVEAYGFFPLTNNFIGYTAIFTTALNSMSGRYITTSLEQHNVQEVNIYFNSVLWGNIGLALLFLIIGSFLTYFVSFFLAVPVLLLDDVRLLLALAFLGLFISLSSTVFSVGAFALSRFDRQAVINILSNSLRLGVILLLFWLFTPKLFFLGAATLVSVAYYALQNYRLTRRLIPQLQLDFNFFSWTALRILLTSGIWNSLSALSNVINNQLDLFIANKFYGAKDMGLLSLSKIAPGFLQIMFSVIVPIFLPDLIRMYARGDEALLKKELDFSFKAIFMFALLPISIFFVYGREFFQLWVPSENSETLYILSVLTLIPFLVHATIETVHNIFVITDKLKVAALWGGCVAMTNFLLTLMLCNYSKLGLYAIPLAALITGGVSHLTFTPLYAAKCLAESSAYFYKRIMRGFLSFGLLLAILFLWKYFALIPVDTWILLGCNCLILALICFLVILYIHLNKLQRVTAYQLLLRKIR